MSEHDVESTANDEEEGLVDAVDSEESEEELEVEITLEELEALPEGRRLLRELPVHMTQEELEKLITEFSQKIQEKERVEAEKTRAAKEYKEHIDGISDRLRTLANIVRRKMRDQDVECLWRMDFETGQKYCVRLDTNEVVAIEEITPDERTAELEFGEVTTITEDEDGVYVEVNLTSTSEEGLPLLLMLHNHKTEGGQWSCSYILSKTTESGNEPIASADVEDQHESVGAAAILGIEALRTDITTTDWEVENAEWVTTLDEELHRLAVEIEQGGLPESEEEQEEPDTLDRLEVVS